MLGVLPSSSRHGERGVEITARWATNVNFHVLTRAEGIQYCGHLSHDFYHIGDIPTDREVRSSYDSRRASFSKKDFEFDVGDYDDPEHDEDSLSP